MSDPNTKIKTSKRRHADETKVKRQVKIAKQHGLGFNDDVIKEPHRLVKRHAMDCGTPGCMLCGNRRHNKALKTKEKLTFQEHRMFQDTDAVNDKHSNGLPKPKD
jgi:hypothetical protein